MHINGANKTKSEPREQSKALLSSRAELEKESQVGCLRTAAQTETKAETGGQSRESQAEKPNQEQVASLEAATVKAASLKRDLSSNEEQKLVSENGNEIEMEMENSQVVDWSSDQSRLERLSGEQEEGKEEDKGCEKSAGSEKSDTCCSISQSTAESFEKAADLSDSQKVSTTPSLTTASIAEKATTTTTTTAATTSTCAAAAPTESETTPVEVSTSTKSQDNNSSWSGACAEEASRAAQIDWQSRLSCRLASSGNNNSLSFEQQVAARNKDETESHEIVIDSNSMSRFEESPIRVRDVESNTTKSGQMCSKPNLDQNDHKMLITFAALKQQQQQQTNEEKVSHKLVTESEKTNKMDINQQVINEAARRNDLIKFFSHYKGKFNDAAQ